MKQKPKVSRLKLEWDSYKWRQERDHRLSEWFLGNVDAVRTFVILSSISETWDDLVDGDKPMLPGEIHDAFIKALFELQANPFYAQHRMYLDPVIMVGINAWMDANNLEGSDDEKWRMLAFYIRNYAAEIAQAIALCVGGFEHMRQVSLHIRQFLNHESYKDWEHRKHD